MKYPILTLLILGLIVTGCDPYGSDEYQEYVVLESYIVADRPLPVVRLSKTLPSDEEYSFQNAALSGANVLITLLDENGDDAVSFNYMQRSQSFNGIYVPTNQEHMVIPRRTYRIDIDFNNRDDELTAHTTVPDQISIINEIPERIEYRGDQQLEIVLSPTERTEAQNRYVFNAIKENPREDLLTPFYLASVADGNSDPEDFANNSSGLINEGNFDIDDEGTTTLLFPWIGVAFFEENLIVINSVDSEMGEFLRSQNVQLGGSTLPPGEIPNVRYNVEGGIGIFGSIASDTVSTFFSEPGSDLN